MRYIAAPAPLEAGGPLGLNALHQRLALYQAASLWCINHPSDENTVRYNGYQQVIAKLLPGAKRRQAFPDEGYSPSFRPLVERRGTPR